MKISEKDLIIITTGFTNEILGSIDFLLNIPDIRRPNISILIHQLFPPESNFTKACSEQNQNKWLGLLSNAFKDIKQLKDKLRIFSTSSSKLQKILSNLSDTEVRALPLPYNNILNNDVRPHSNKLTLGFLGDDRYEKGLHILLKAIKNKPIDADFIIQVIAPRGYTDNKQKELSQLICSLEERDHINFHHGKLDSKSFSDMMASCDIIVLPYHPYSYNLRVSGIFIQSQLMGKPAVVSSNTWLSEEIERFNSGV
ncbi:MAG: glycosyltransferase, partial [Patescibacteria group bacterium]|nr:glycosyltransferase [Patescibacteria group bacterium]